MTTNDLQLTTTDVRSGMTIRSRRQGYGGAGVADDGQELNPLTFLKDALRRQWLLLLLALLISGGVAWLFSTHWSSVSVTAHSRLWSQTLPHATSGTYTVPNSVAIGKLIRSPDVLQPVVEQHSLPSVRFLAKQMKVDTDHRTGILDVSLVLPEQVPVVAVLDDIGEQLIREVALRRDQQLSEHARFISTLLTPAVSQLDSARLALFSQMQNELENRQESDQVQQFAEVQGLISQRQQMATMLDTARRRLGNPARNLSRLQSGEQALLSASIRQVLEGRRRQIEGYGKYLKSATRQSALKQKVLQQLAYLEEEIPSVEDCCGAVPVNEPSLDSEVPGSEVPEPVLPDQEQRPQVTAAVAESGRRIASASPAENSGQRDAFPQYTRTQASATEPSSTALARFTDWSRRVLNVGLEIVGNFDEATQALIQETQQQLQDIQVQKNDLQNQQEDLQSDIDYYTAAVVQAEQQLVDAPVARNALDTSPQLMKSQADVTQAELRYNTLVQQLDRINQVKQCQINDYLTTPATTSADERKGNRFKLFVLSLFGSFLVLAAPAAVLEYRHQRPSPATRFSRRWNLPVLGLQKRPAMTASSADFVRNDLQHEVRLMALRIQQSLVQSGGRVVLFSGLDHTDSPLRLMKELAVCLSQREESVLVIQTSPSQPTSIALAASEQSGNGAKIVASVDESTSGQSQASGSPTGVAEFLAGHCNDVRELVTETALPNVAFLPGGCAATASEAMASRRLSALVEQCRQRYSIILMCGPSTLNPADLQMLAARADGIVFTVTPQSLKSVYGDEVIGDLMELGAPVLGFADSTPFPASDFDSEFDSVADSHWD